MSDHIMLSAHHLDVTLSRRRIVHQASLSLERGHLAALVGPNGAGKTTLLRALAGLIPSEGDVHVDGKDMRELSLSERARHFGYLPQGHIVHWPLTVRDVVSLGRYPHGSTNPTQLSARDEQAVHRAMDFTDVTTLRERRVTELSGGERSRVALARVFAVEAPVVLADEPTASLDPRHQIDIMNNLRGLADGGTLVIVVTHDLGLAARFADTVLVMSDGRIIAQGAPRDALSDSIVRDVFRVDTYRTEFKNQSVILPWSGI